MSIEATLDAAFGRQGKDRLIEDVRRGHAVALAILSDFLTATAGRIRISDEGYRNRMRILDILSDYPSGFLDQTHMQTRVTLDLGMRHDEAFSGWLALYDILEGIDSLALTSKAVHAGTSEPKLVADDITRKDRYFRRGISLAFLTKDISRNISEDEDIAEGIAIVTKDAFLALVFSTSGKPLIENLPKTGGFCCDDMRYTALSDRMKAPPTLHPVIDDDGWNNFHYAVIRPRTGPIMDKKTANHIRNLADAGVPYLPARDGLTPRDIVRATRGSHAIETNDALDYAILKTKQGYRTTGSRKHFSAL